MLEQRFRALSAFEARPSRAFERPVAACASQQRQGCVFECCRTRSNLLDQRLRALSGFEAHASSDFERPSRLEPVSNSDFRSPRRSDVGSSCPLRASQRNRADSADLNAPAQPSGLQWPIRAPHRCRAGPKGQISSTAARPSGLERRRSRKRRQVRCFRIKPRRVKILRRKQNT